MSAKWQNVDAGPRQVKDFNRAAAALRSEGQAQTELSGVVGGREHRSTVIVMMGVVRSEVTALQESVGSKYGWQVTRANVRSVIADLEAALAEARKSRPVQDNRRSPEEEAERAAAQEAREAKYRAAQEAQDAVTAQVMAKAPAGAKALIFAEYHVDNSDPMTDYFNSVTNRTVAIGFRFSSREDFRALHAAAAQFTETAGVEFSEHRENYSMGGGNYLSDHGSSRSGSGWVVKSRAFPCPYVGLTEDAIPEQPAAPAAPAASGGAVTVSPSSTGKPGVVEVRFAEKPSAEVRAELKARGFRWASSSACWYGKDAGFAESLASAVQEAAPQAEAAAPAESEPADVPAPAAATSVPQRSRAVDADVLAVIGRAVVDGSEVRITERLDRAMYARVNKALEALGGKWNRKAQAHVFPGDAAPVLAALLEGGRVTTAQDEGWFPTPPPVVAEILALADLEPGMEVLEPSAGEGAIARAAADAGCTVDCVELNGTRAASLCTAGVFRTVTCGDFLAVPQRPVYNRVLMNPPFAGKADIEHVRHAAGFLRPGGLLVAVMPAGAAFRADRATAAFREMVAASGGEITSLPEGAFKASGTDVRTVLVTLPAAAERSAAA